MNKNHFISTKFTSGGQDFEFPELSITDYNIQGVEQIDRIRRKLK